MSAALKIVIPTADRPQSLRGVLDYYARFYPDADIVVADGSSRGAQEQNQQTADDARVAVDYRAFEPDVPVFERLLRVVRDLDAEFLVMGADDNYPILETLERARKRLVDRPDAECAGGHIVHLEVHGAGRATAQLDPVRHIVADNPAQRMRVFSALPFPTAYGVARRAAVQARLEFLREWYLPTFYVLGVGLHDVARGGYLAYPEIGFICTSNFVDDLRHTEEPLACLRAADQVLAMYDEIYERASRVPEFVPDATRDVMTRAIGQHVAELAGVPPHRVVGFADRAPFRTPIVEGARQLFRDLFLAGTAQREAYAEKLAFIGEQLQQLTASQDHSAEAGSR